MRARLDFDDWRSGTGDPLIPPRRYGLPSQIAAVGDLLVGFMEDEGQMRRDAAVLDIGCGPGRTAAALTRKLSPSATYEGFDVMPRSIDWCNKAIHSRFPNFHFQVADIQNGDYNPNGTQRASEFVFPYDDASFDIAVAGSLFTHLQPFEGQRYLDETARTLKPGGRLSARGSCSTRRRSALCSTAPRAARALNPDRPTDLHELADEEGNGFKTTDPQTPERMIAIDEDFVRAQHERAGSGSSRSSTAAGPAGGQGRFGQDVLIAERPA